jgi:hypothetical protein
MNVNLDLTKQANDLLERVRRLAEKKDLAAEAFNRVIKCLFNRRILLFAA